MACPLTRLSCHEDTKAQKLVALEVFLFIILDNIHTDTDTLHLPDPFFNTHNFQGIGSEKQIEAFRYIYRLAVIGQLL